jgi:hypothetical protein
MSAAPGVSPTCFIVWQTQAQRFILEAAGFNKTIECQADAETDKPE